MPKKPGIEVEPVFGECELGHTHMIGAHVTIDLREETPGEVIFEDTSSSTVGGGNRKYEANYAKINWDN